MDEGALGRWGGKGGLRHCQVIFQASRRSSVFPAAHLASRFILDWACRFSFSVPAGTPTLIRLCIFWFRIDSDEPRLVHQRSFRVQIVQSKVSFGHASFAPILRAHQWRGKVPHLTLTPAWGRARVRPSETRVRRASTRAIGGGSFYRPPAGHAGKRSTYITVHIYSTTATTGALIRDMTLCGHVACQNATSLVSKAPRVYF